MSLLFLSVKLLLERALRAIPESSLALVVQGYDSQSSISYSGILLFVQYNLLSLYDLWYLFRLLNFVIILVGHLFCSHAEKPYFFCITLITLFLLFRPQGALQLHQLFKHLKASVWRESQNWTIFLLFVPEPILPTQSWGGKKSLQ